jgi:hypothetical protein
MLAKFMVKAPATWWKNKELYKMTDAKIYDNVRATLARNFKSDWAIRESTGDLVAY